MAWQFYYAAQVMLAVYSPTVENERDVMRRTRLLEVGSPTLPVLSLLC